jgi:predicted DNA-binding transcriptional regulator AlpA
MEAIRILMSESDVEDLIYRAETRAYERFMAETGGSNQFWNTKTELRKELGIGSNRLDELIAQGLPAIKLGNRGYKFKKSEVNNWLSKRKEDIYQ